MSENKHVLRHFCRLANLLGVCHVAAMNCSAHPDLVCPCRKTFARFLTYKKDNNQLLKFVLDQMVRDQIKYGTMAGKVDYDGVQRVNIAVDDFEASARELDMHDVSEFYTSDIFQNSKFLLEGDQIVKLFA